MSINLKDIPIFCINLDRRKDRWKKFSTQPSLTQFREITRTSAIDGNKIPLLQNENISLATKHNILNKQRRSHGEIMSMGAIGCTMSHAKVWKEFLEKYPDQQYCLVLEDDVKIPSNLTEILQNISLEEIGSFDVWLLFYTLIDKKIKNLSDHWISPGYFWGTVAYIISRDGAKKLLDTLYPIEVQIDRYMYLKQEIGECKIVIHKGVRVGSLGGSSDIQGGKCRICDVPSDMGDLRVINKYFLAGILTYSMILTFLFIYKKKQ